tara:strand:+ start:578 stop:868 length:291 start_codon:yes stop_codon:yes gene_type:complete
MSQAIVKTKLEADYFTGAKYDGEMLFACHVDISGDGGGIEYCIEELLAVDGKDWNDDLTDAGVELISADIDAFLEADYISKGERDSSPNPFGEWVK